MRDLVGIPFHSVGGGRKRAVSRYYLKWSGTSEKKRNLVGPLPYTESGQEVWQIVCQWVWNLRLSLGQTMQPGKVRELEWSPRHAKLLFSSPLKKPHRKSMVRGSGPPRSDELQGVSGQRTRVLQEDGKLCCPSGAKLWLSEVRQENAFTQRAVYLAYQTDCQHCSLRKQCLSSGAKGQRILSHQPSCSSLSCMESSMSRYSRS